MSSLVYEKGIVTFTFLVTLEETDVHALRRFILEAATKPSDEPYLPDPLEPDEDWEPPTVEEDPQFWASEIVQSFFRNLFIRTRPQNVRLDTRPMRKAEDADHVATLRRKIESGEQQGEIVSIRIEITRPDLTRPYDTRPYLLPFPGISWLTNQVQDTPINGVTLLHMTAAQIPA